jgi:hypothetical protein
MDPFFATFCEPHLPALRAAGGWAAQFEFSVRMTAAALFGDGTSKDLGAMFDRLMEELRPCLSPDQVEALTSIGLCQLRHDIIHCRLSKAYGKLGGKGNDPAVIRVMKLDDSRSILDQVTEAVAGAAVPLPQTKTADGTIMGWLAQAGGMGIFPAAAQAFERACAAMHAGMDERARRILEVAGTAVSGPSTR